MSTFAKFVGEDALLAWQVHARTKARREKLAERFRDPDDPFKIVIVRDMWLILRKYGYPPDKQEKATQAVLEQAAVLSEVWATGTTSPS